MLIEASLENVGSCVKSIAIIRLGKGVEKEAVTKPSLVDPKSWENNIGYSTLIPTLETATGPTVQQILRKCFLLKNMGWGERIFMSVSLSSRRDFYTFLPGRIGVEIMIDQ